MDAKLIAGDDGCKLVMTATDQATKQPIDLKGARVEVRSRCVERRLSHSSGRWFDAHQFEPFRSADRKKGVTASIPTAAFEPGRDISRAVDV